MSNQICDFCSEPKVAWRYPAQSFLAYVVAGVVGQSVGDWAACRICHGLIETGNRIGLLERSLCTLLDRIRTCARPRRNCADRSLISTRCSSRTRRVAPLWFKAYPCRS